jgi:hypothetical protein
MAINIYIYIYIYIYDCLMYVVCSGVSGVFTCSVFAARSYAGVVAAGTEDMVQHLLLLLPKVHLRVLHTSATRENVRDLMCFRHLCPCVHIHARVSGRAHTRALVCVRMYNGAYKRTKAGISGEREGQLRMGSGKNEMRADFQGSSFIISFFGSTFQPTPLSFRLFVLNFFSLLLTLFPALTGLVSSYGFNVSLYSFSNFLIF